MSNYTNFGGYDNQGKWVSCFPENNVEHSQEDELTDERKNKICRDVDQIINSINQKRRDGSKLIDILNDELNKRKLGLVNDFDNCAEIKVFYNDKEGKSSTTLHNFITNSVVPFWLRCWQKNNVTIIITKSWNNPEAKRFFNLYINNYCLSKNHLVYVLLENNSLEKLEPLTPTK
jgi:hypothetical protein